MALAVGKISEMHRYPVKSFAGESLSSCTIESYGLFGDRFYAFRDETKEGWAGYITARDVPELLGYQARLIDGEVSVSAPDGRVMEWNDGLRKEVQQYSGRKISMADYRLKSDERPHLMAVDEASVLLITDRTLRRLEEIWGKPVKAGRFRANFLIALDENGWDESQWIGKRLRIGEAQLQVEKACERCAMITIDPESLERDPSLLKAVYEKMDLNFGVYASVRKPGRIQVGDKVYLWGG
jgi:uncharacterized protein